MQIQFVMAWLNCIETIYGPDCQGLILTSRLFDISSLPILISLSVPPLFSALEVVVFKQSKKGEYVYSN
jgi:hypothetical protein